MKKEDKKIQIFLLVQEKGKTDKRWYRYDLENKFELDGAKICKTRLCAGLPDKDIPKWQDSDN